MEILPIAHIKSPFNNKFGIPRQSGTTDLVSEIVFEKEFSVPSAIKGIEEFSHLWLIWEFTEAKRENFSPTVRPPRLGGNKRVGVFASRSPFRPNSLGLSCVKLINTKFENGIVSLIVSGADLLCGTPIYDIKPYLPSFDCPKDAKGSYSDQNSTHCLEVIFPEELRALVPPHQLAGLSRILSEDPRPSYQNDEDRIYGFTFDNLEIKFKVSSNTLTVVALQT